MNVTSVVKEIPRLRRSRRRGRRACTPLADLGDACRRPLRRRRVRMQARSAAPEGGQGRAGGGEVPGKIGQVTHIHTNGA